MNYKNLFFLIITFFILITLTQTVFALSSISNFSINSGSFYTKQTTITLTQTITNDENCQMCFIQGDNNADNCLLRVDCEDTAAYTLTGSDESKTIYAFIYDNGTKSSEASDSITLDTTAPIATVTGVTDGNYYPTEDSVITINVTENIGIDKNSFDFSGSQNFVVSGDSTALTATLTLTNLSEGTHSITYDVNDLAGHIITNKITWIVDKTAPITSQKSSSTLWTNDLTPEFTVTEYIDINHQQYALNSTNAKIAFKCKQNTGTWFERSYTTSITDFNITNSTYDCNSDQGYKKIFFKVQDGAARWSNDSNFTIGYDTTNPSVPTSLSVTPGNGQVILSWSAPSADNFSGNKEYKIYKNTYTSPIATTKSTSYTASNLTNGTQYCFKVSTIDNAGNESTKTSEVCATPQSVSTTISVKRNNSEIEYAKNDDEITINCSFSESASSAKIYAKYDSQSTQTIKSSSSSVTSISETMNIEGSYSQLRVWCEANGTSSSNKYITIDSTAPTIEWSDTNNDCSLLKKIMVKATDNKSLNKVDFLINNITYTTTKTDNNYYLDFNTQTLENGNYAIKAIAYDGAENIKEITRTININNILSENQICQKAITEAKAKKKIIEDLIKYLQEQGIIINTDILNKKKSADDLFNGAEVEQTINVNSATKKAEDAKKMYDEINTKLSNETKEAKNYETKEGTVKSTLKEIGFSEDIASIGEENSKNNERKLKIIQVGEEYHAVIELTIKNDTNSNTIKVIEIIPKELIDKASRIFSDQNFIILQEDPIIEFNLTLAPGETKTISYGTGVVTKEKSEELITKEIINNFASNPITLSEEIETKKIIEESNMSGMILIGGAIILVLLFIAILIIGGTILLKKTHGFGGEKTPTETKQVEIELKKEESWPKNPQ